jgi:hypothetical protein
MGSFRERRSLVLELKELLDNLARYIGCRVEILQPSLDSYSVGKISKVSDLIPSMIPVNGDEPEEVGRIEITFEWLFEFNVFSGVWEPYDKERLWAAFGFPLRWEDEVIIKEDGTLQLIDPITKAYQEPTTFHFYPQGHPNIPKI